MDLVANSSTLVIVGSWNPAILSPNWIASHALGYPANAEFTVNLELPIQGIGIHPPKMSFDDIAVTVNQDKITFVLDSTSDEKAKKSVEVAAKILEKLPHTPINALGFNFVFEDKSPNDKLLSRFDNNTDIVHFVDDANVELVESQWRSTLKMSDHLLKVDATKKAGVASVKLNHHFECSSAGGAVEILRKVNMYSELTAISKKFADQISNGG